MKLEVQQKLLTHSENIAPDLIKLDGKRWLPFLYNEKLFQGKLTLCFQMISLSAYFYNSYPIYRDIKIVLCLTFDEIQFLTQYVISWHKIKNTFGLIILWEILGKVYRFITFCIILSLYDNLIQ